MTTNSETRDATAGANPQPGRPGTEPLLWTHAKATLVVVLEFTALQFVAVGLATGIYSLIPLLDLDFKRTFDDWMRAFQILSPTLSISGGAAIVLSSYFFHKQAREADQNAAEANQRAAEASQKAAQASQSAEEARQSAGEAKQRADLAEQERAAERELRLAAEQREATLAATLATVQSDLAEMKARQEAQAEQARMPSRRRRRSLR